MGHMGVGSDDDSDLSDDDSPKKRRDLLTRRPSYRKILNDLGGGEIGKFVVCLIEFESCVDAKMKTVKLKT